MSLESGMAKTLKFIAQSCPSSLNFALSSIRPYAKLSSSSFRESVASSGIRRPLSKIVKQLTKKVPDSIVNVRHRNGFSYKHVPWHVVNRKMNVHAVDNSQSEHRHLGSVQELLQ